MNAIGTAKPTTRDKALRMNVDAGRYGTFAEIGAGQEVARWFFRVGGAAGTVAKTISAYDTAVSDALYGPAERYVSRERLLAMLDREYARLRQQLSVRRGGRVAFFVFADTVATRSYSRPEDGHGWIGVRFEATPLGDPSDVILHVYLFDKDPARQQEAVGVLGVNLLHAAVYDHATPTALIGSLMDGLDGERVEIDLVTFSGPAFAGFDGRLASLELVERGFTDAIMLASDGTVVQPSEVLHKRPILVERGSFRPPTNATLDVLESARERFLLEPDLDGREPVVLLEMTLRSLTDENGVDHHDFLDRAEVLHALGHHVLITRSQRNFALIEVLARFSQSRIGVALGVPMLRTMIDEQYYDDLPGGQLEAIGRFFKNAVKLYVYPTIDDLTSGVVVTADTMSVPSTMRHLYRHLLENRRIEPLERYDRAHLAIRTRDVLDGLARGSSHWEASVPTGVAKIIRERNLFGYRSQGEYNV